MNEGTGFGDFEVVPTQFRLRMCKRRLSSRRSTMIKIRMSVNILLQLNTMIGSNSVKPALQHTACPVRFPRSNSSTSNHPPKPGIQVICMDVARDPEP